MTIVDVLKAAAYAVAAVWALWGLYVLLMGVRRAQLARTLGWVDYVLAAPYVVAGFLLDWALNWTVFLVIFMQAPDAPFELVTDRLKRYMSPAWEEGRRKRLARWICHKRLDMFDPDRHCEPGGKLPEQ